VIQIPAIRFCCATHPRAAWLLLTPCGWAVVLLRVVPITIHSPLTKTALEAYIVTNGVLKRLKHPLGDSALVGKVAR
jgi:hypothetical protein